MPLHTRLLCMAAGVARQGVATMKPEEIALRRALTPDPRFPVTLVTGGVRQHIVRDTVRLPMRDGTEIPAHAGAAPALLQTAEFDPLAEEGADYAAALERSGVSTRLTHYPGVPHGFLNIPGFAPVARQARWEIVDTLRNWLS